MLSPLENAVVVRKRYVSFDVLETNLTLEASKCTWTDEFASLMAPSSGLGKSRWESRDMVAGMGRELEGC